MDQAVIVLFIFAASLVLFALEIFPITVTALLGALAMVFCGVLSFEQAFAGFGSDTLMMVVGMLICGQAITQTGLSQRMTKAVKSLAGLSERRFIGVATTVTGVVSGFMSNTAMMAAFLPLIRSLQNDNRRLAQGKTLGISLASAAVLGGNLTLIGSTPQLAVNQVLIGSGLPALEFFTLLKGGVFLLAIAVIYYVTVGCIIARRLKIGCTIDSGQDKKPFSDPQSEPQSNPQQSANLAEASLHKQVLALLIFVVCIAAFVSGIFPVGAIALGGAIALVLARCISLEQIVHKVDWATVVVLGGSLGLSEGLVRSGAGEFVALKIVQICQAVGAGPFFAFGLVVVLIAILTQMMSNTALVAVFTPIGIHLAQETGFSLLTMAVGIIFAASLVMTPLGTPPFTMTLSLGYRFTDYLKAGAPLCLILLLATIFFIPLLYGY